MFSIHRTHTHQPIAYVVYEHYNTWQLPMCDGIEDGTCFAGKVCVGVCSVTLSLKLIISYIIMVYNLTQPIHKKDSIICIYGLKMVKDSFSQKPKKYVLLYWAVFCVCLMFFRGATMTWVVASFVFASSNIRVYMLYTNTHAHAIRRVKSVRARGVNRSDVCSVCERHVEPERQIAVFLYVYMIVGSCATSHNINTASVWAARTFLHQEPSTTVVAPVEAI